MVYFVIHFLRMILIVLFDVFMTRIIFLRVGKRGSNDIQLIQHKVHIWISIKNRCCHKKDMTVMFHNLHTIYSLYNKIIPCFTEKNYLFFLLAKRKCPQPVIENIIEIIIQAKPVFTCYAINTGEKHIAITLK